MNNAWENLIKKKGKKRVLNCIGIDEKGKSGLQNKDIRWNESIRLLSLIFHVNWDHH